MRKITTIGFIGILVVVFSYLLLAAPMNLYKTGVAKELYLFQHENPTYSNLKETEKTAWRDRVLQWRQSNYLTVTDVYDFYFPYTSLNAFTVGKYEIIPNDDLGKEFREFVNVTLPAIQAQHDEAQSIKTEKMMETVRKNEGA